MAVAVRTRTVPEIQWEKEDEAQRERRRRQLALLDGYLFRLEECNLRSGGQVPAFLHAAIVRLGVPLRPDDRAPEVIEAIFAVQEAFMLQQVGPVPLPFERTIDDLRRRLAS